MSESVSNFGLPEPSRLVSIKSLPGGNSARVSVLQAVTPEGDCIRRVIRRYGDADITSDSHIARKEFELLSFLKTRGIPVPTPLVRDPSGRFIVIEFVDGETGLPKESQGEYVEQMASTLASLHQIGVDHEDLPKLPSFERRFEGLTQKLESEREPKVCEWREKLENSPPKILNPLAILHGDFWPGNVLRNADRIAANIDWEDAAVGDPVAEVANARLELFIASDSELMNDFTAAYAAKNCIDLAGLRSWEVAAALLLWTKVGKWAMPIYAEKQIRERILRFLAG